MVRSQLVRERRLVMAVPVALEAFLRVVLSLETQEVNELRIAGLHLLAGREAVIGEEVTAAVFDQAVDDAAEVLGRLAFAFVGVQDVQVANRQLRQTKGRPGAGGNFENFAA